MAMQKPSNTPKEIDKMLVVLNHARKKAYQVHARAKASRASSKGRALTALERAHERAQGEMDREYRKVRESIFIMYDKVDEDFDKIFAEVIKAYTEIERTCAAIHTGNGDTVTLGNGGVVGSDGGEEGTAMCGFVK